MRYTATNAMSTAVALEWRGSVTGVLLRTAVARRVAAHARRCDRVGVVRLDRIRFDGQACGFLERRQHDRRARRAHLGQRSETFAQETAQRFGIGDPHLDEVAIL